MKGVKKMNNVYTLKNLREMIRSTDVKCVMCGGKCKRLDNESGISVTDTHSRLIVNGVCPEHGLQFNAHVL
jgi:hypothetical protein